MRESKKSLTTKWEVSVIQFQEDEEIKYKVTRRIPELNVAETKIFNSKNDTKELFEEWLK